jgi:catechol 2,3-dioxygenase-like lactoylglutathione lyase family enzyme
MTRTAGLASRIRGEDVVFVKENIIDLGAFSISLAVKNIEVSKEFYEKLGFNVIGGDISQNWLLLKKSSHLIGLFQGMLEKNTLTFNPGWDQNGTQLGSFTEVRELQHKLKSEGIELSNEIDENSTGPAIFMVIDPDGNPILVDQHVA